MKTYTKNQAHKLFGTKNDAQLAKVLGLARSTVWRWPESEPAPPSGQWVILRKLDKMRF